MAALLKSYSPGDTVTVSIFRKNVLQDFELVFGGGGNIKYVLKEIEEPSTLQREILKSWLKEKIEDRR